MKLKGWSYCINFIEKNTSSAYKKLGNTQRNDCEITMLQKRYNMFFITGKQWEKWYHNYEKTQEIGTKLVVSQYS